MIDKIDAIKTARKIIDERLKVAPNFDLFNSIHQQIIYIEDVVNGNQTDKSKLSKINVGLYAVREFDESDPELSTALKKIQYIADRMSKGLKV